MAIDENEQRLKDQLRMIEMGETLEDLNDPEEYEDQGGINSLKKAPSIKLASEPGAEEFQLELSTVIAEYNDLTSKGDPAVRDISLDQFIDAYFSRKKMMQEGRATVMGGGMMRTGYAIGSNQADPYTEPYEMKDGKKKFIDLPERLYTSSFDARDAADKEDATMFRDMQKTNVPVKKKNRSLDLDIEKIKKLIEKRKKEKKKLAMGGIAGVL